MNQYKVITEMVQFVDGAMHEMGKILDLDPEHEDTKNLLEQNAIELVAEPMKEDVKNEEVPAPTTPAVVGGVEPRPRYRGQVILVDGPRTLGSQTFHHIRTEDGHEYDLTDAEYAGEVHVSYPPVK